MQLTLYTVDECSSCQQAIIDLQKYVESRKGVSLTIKNLNEESELNIIIVPALFVEDELYSYGKINLDKLDNYIKGK